MKPILWGEGGIELEGWRWSKGMGEEEMWAFYRQPFSTELPSNLNLESRYVPVERGGSRRSESETPISLIGARGGQEIQ